MLADLKLVQATVQCLRGHHEVRNRKKRVFLLVPSKMSLFAVNDIRCHYFDLKSVWWDVYMLNQLTFFQIGALLQHISSAEVYEQKGVSEVILSVSGDTSTCAPYIGGNSSDAWLIVCL
jgi:hypothetical protein